MRTAGKILQDARERLGFSNPIALAKSQSGTGRHFSSKDLADFENDKLNDYLSKNPDEAKCLIDLYQLTPSEARECVAIWSAADRAKVAAWDALCPLSDAEIQDLIEKLEPGDRVGPFTVSSNFLHHAEPSVFFRASMQTNAIGLRPNDIAALIQAFGGITKKEGT